MGFIGAIVMLKRNNIIENYFDDECLLLNTSTQKTHYLNEVATWIWKRLDNSFDKKKLCCELCEEFDISYDIALRDMDELLLHLEQAMVISYNE